MAKSISDKRKRKVGKRSLVSTEYGRSYTKKINKSDVEVLFIIQKGAINTHWIYEFYDFLYKIAIASVFIKLWPHKV